MAHVEAREPRRLGLAGASSRNLLAFACTLLAQFITVPLVVRWVGLDAFGVASLVIALTAPLTVAGTALAQAMTREMSARIGQSDHDGAKRAQETARVLCLLVCGAGAALIVGLGPWLLGAIGGNDYSASAGWPLFFWAAAGWAGQQATLLNQGGCAAIQDFARMARVAAIAALVTVAATLGMTYLAPTATGYMAGFSLSWVLTWLCWIATSNRSKWLPAWHLDRQALGPLLHFGKWQSAAQLAGVASNQVDRYVLAAMVPASVVGQYSTAKRLEEAVYIGVIKLTEVLFPYFGATSGESLESRQRFFVKASWLVGTLSVAVLGPIVPLADGVLRIWAGSEAAVGGAFLLQVLILGGVFGCGSNVFTYCAMGLNLNALVARLAWIYSLLTVGASVALLWWLGPIAAGVGLLAASVVRVIIAMAWVRRDLFPQIGWSTLIACTGMPMLAGVAIALGLAYAGRGLVLSWWAVILLYPVIAASIAFTSIALTSLSGAGRVILAALKSSLRQA